MTRKWHNQKEIPTSKTNDLWEDPIFRLVAIQLHGLKNTKYMKTYTVQPAQKSTLTH